MSSATTRSGSSAPAGPATLFPMSRVVRPPIVQEIPFLGRDCALDDAHVRASIHAYRLSEHGVCLMTGGRKERFEAPAAPPLQTMVVQRRYHHSRSISAGFKGSLAAAAVTAAAVTIAMMTRMRCIEPPWETSQPLSPWEIAKFLRSP